MWLKIEGTNPSIYLDCLTTSISINFLPQYSHLLKMVRSRSLSILEKIPTLWTNGFNLHNNCICIIIVMHGHGRTSVIKTSGLQIFCFSLNLFGFYHWVSFVSIHDWITKSSLIQFIISNRAKWSGFIIHLWFYILIS